MVTAEHIGKAVTDGVRTGVLMAICEDVDENLLPAYQNPILMAWVRPTRGGIEWNVRPSALELT